ncbi:hypothetical protein [Salinisphaera sp. T31B1]|uniref:hypothetical protein n=1 Tax=Salinisphaera sp. T31B1 TaxID=727963 RepID=UPI00333F756B
MNGERQTRITDRQAIADAFVHMTRRVDQITLQFPTQAVRYPVDVISVDRALGRCALSLLALADIQTILARGQYFALHARQLDGELGTEAMHALSIEPYRADQIRLRCPLPETLTLARRRHDFRAALDQGMLARATLVTADAPDLLGRLCNLSVGGGLIRLPARTGRLVGSPTRACRLQIAFPNGERLSRAGQIRRIYHRAGSGPTDVAVVFDTDIASADSLWSHVCEIEREAARRQRPPDPLRPLARSRLFQPAGDSD